jgi:predicted phage tail protein
MKTVKLYGHLGKKYGKIFRFKATSVVEVLKLLKANFRDFTSEIAGFTGAGYKVFVGNTQVSLEELNHPVSDSEVIKIVPIVSGAGGGDGQGILMVIAGVALIAMTGGSATPWVAQMGTAVGMSLVMAGISNLLYAAPEVQADKGSLNFTGPLNSAKQGECVPIGYGRVMVGSAVISTGISTVLFTGV